MSSGSPPGLSTERQQPPTCRVLAMPVLPTPFLLTSRGLLLLAAKAFLSSGEFGTKSGVGMTLQHLCTVSGGGRRGGVWRCWGCGHRGPGVIQVDAQPGQLDLPVQCPAQRPLEAAVDGDQGHDSGGTIQRGRGGTRPAGAFMGREEEEAELPTSTGEGR